MLSAVAGWKQQQKKTVKIMEYSKIEDEPL